MLLHLSAEIRSQSELTDHQTQMSYRDADSVTGNMPESVDNDLGYNSRRYQPSGVNTFVVFPSLHYRKLQKEANIPNIQTQNCDFLQMIEKKQRISEVGAD